LTAWPSPARDCFSRPLTAACGAWREDRETYPPLDMQGEKKQAEEKTTTNEGEEKTDDER
jgi:hypothetical protein